MLKEQYTRGRHNKDISRKLTTGQLSFIDGPWRANELAWCQSQEVARTALNNMRRRCDHKYISQTDPRRSERQAIAMVTPLTSWPTQDGRLVMQFKRSLQSSYSRVKEAGNSEKNESYRLEFCGPLHVRTVSLDALGNQCAAPNERDYCRWLCG